MSQPLNLFEDVLQKELADVFSQFTTVPIHVGENDEVIDLPLIVINDIGGPEGVFQSGIYQHTVEFYAKTNSVGGTGFDAAQANRELVATVLDILQLVDLRARLMDSNKLFLSGPTGLVLGTTGPLEIVGDNKVWQRKIECDFFGYSRS